MLLRKDKKKQIIHSYDFYWMQNKSLIPVETESVKLHYESACSGSFLIKKITELAINWAKPYVTSLEVEYW